MSDQILNALTPIAAGSLLTLIVTWLTNWQADRRAAKREAMNYMRLREDASRLEARERVEQILDTLNDAISQPRGATTDGWLKWMTTEQIRGINNAVHWIPDAATRGAVQDGISVFAIGSALDKLHDAEKIIVLNAVREIVAAYVRGDAIPQAEVFRISVAMDRVYKDD
ncbi:hypothetical protein [Agreia bicolorata]|uniref:Phage holin, LL-H family n=1 Tax=Agreia bicolorata TaxID=110935 RepID=A0ABR5CIR9_9MICO|nr:hypothetical protein [Agreia bicolorata]KJC65539.1 hypothetical protein TZ00_01465 [Agreia bicolorata]